MAGNDDDGPGMALHCGDAAHDLDAVQSGHAKIRFTPVIMLTGHAAESKVSKIRNCGSSFIVTKPLTPAVLLQRILWLGTDEREMVVSDNYVGPDRRVRNFGPPMGMAGRRTGDLSAHLGEATDVNMDQSDIDMMMKPMRISL